MPPESPNASVNRVAEAKAFYKLVVSAEQVQRRQEIDAKKFHANDQWPAWIKTQRAGSPQGTPGAVGARPCITINQVKAPVDQVVNAIKSARLAVKLAPKGKGATAKLAEIREGLCRAIQVDSRANMARNWAAESAAISGRGYYRIHKEYANDGDFDQDITIKRILNQSSVYLDPFAQEPDWSDGERGLITEDVPLERFKSRHPDSKVASMDERELAGESATEFTSDGDVTAKWVRQDDKIGWIIRIAEYFYVTYEKRTLLLYTDAQGNERTGFQEDIGVIPDAQLIQKRQVQERIVDWCLVSCNEVLDETRWDGRFIPIIPVIGNEYNVGGARKWDGIVNESAQEANRLFNFLNSAQAEAVGIGTRSPYMLDPRQIEGYEAFWNQSNTRTFPYLPFRRFINGQDYGAPARNEGEQPIEAITISLAQAKDNIHLTTGVPPVSLGNLDPHERSGKAIRALQQVSDQGSSNYMDSLATISITLEGKILNDLIGKVYDRPGRVVRILGLDDEASDVMLNAPFVKGPNGQPMPVAEAQKSGMELTADDVLHYDMSAGEFSVIPEVGKSENSRREAGSTAMGELMEAAPQLAPAVADLWVGDMDFPGAPKIAERLKKMLPPPLQDADEQGAKQKAAQDQQRLQQLDQVAQMQHDVIEQLQREKEGKVLELASKEKIAEMDNRTKLAIAELNAKLTAAGAIADAQMAELTQRMDHAHEVGMAAHAAAIGAGQADQQHQQGLEMADVGHQQALEQGQQAADLAPQPEAGA